MPCQSYVILWLILCILESHNRFDFRKCVGLFWQICRALLNFERSLCSVSHYVILWSFCMLWSVCMYGMISHDVSYDRHVCYDHWQYVCYDRYVYYDQYACYDQYVCTLWWIWTAASCEHVSVKHCPMMQRTATHCNTLQHTATHCNTL